MNQHVQTTVSVKKVAFLTRTGGVLRSTGKEYYDQCWYKESTRCDGRRLREVDIPLSYTSGGVNPAHRARFIKPEG